MRSPLKVDVLFAMLDSAGVSSSDVARALNVSPVTVHNWRKGAHSLTETNYAALVALAASHETSWLAIHRTKTKQPPQEEPIPGYRVHVQAFAAENYQEHMHQSVRACVESLRARIAEPPAWDYEQLCAHTEELAGMFRALRIIMTPPEEKDKP